MRDKAKILIVEDEKNIQVFLCELLVQEGYEVMVIADGDIALTYISENRYDLVLLDLKLGQGMSGIDVLQAIRQQTADTTVIILTAHGSLDTAIEALRLGAYDYLLKPCKPDEIRQSVKQGLQKHQETVHQQKAISQVEEILSHTLANIRATTSPTEPMPLSQEERFLRQGSLIIDQVRHTITYYGHLLDLSPIQYDLLLYLVKAAPRVVPPQELAQNVCHYNLDELESSNMIRPHIYRLRQRMKTVNADELSIQTVRGVGYTVM